MRMSAIICCCSLLAAAETAGVPRARAASASAKNGPKIVFVITLSLGSDDEMRAAIFRPRVFVVPRVEGEFFPVAHRPQSIGWDAERHQVRAGGNGPSFSQCKIVLGRASLVAVAFDCDVPGGVFLQRGGIGV